MNKLTLLLMHKFHFSGSFSILTLIAIQFLPFYLLSYTSRVLFSTKHLVSDSEQIINMKKQL